VEVKDDTSQDTSPMLRSVWRLFAVDAAALARVAALAVVAAALAMATATLNRAVIAQFAHPSAVWRLTGLWGLLLVGMVVLSGMAVVLAYRVGTAVVARLAKTVFDRLARQSLRYHEGNGVSEAHTVLTRCLQEVEFNFTNVLSHAIPGLALGIGGLVAMAYMNWRWLIVAGPLVVLVALGGRWIGRRQRRLTRRLIELDRRAVEIIETVLDERRLRVVKRNALEAMFVSQFGEVTRRREEVMRERSVGWGIRTQLYTMVPLLGAPIVWLTARAGSSGVAEAATIGALLPQMLLAVTRLTDWYVGLAEVWPYLDRALRIVDGRRLPEDPPAPDVDYTIKPEDLTGRLILSGVYYKRGGRMVLNGIDSTMEPGSYIVLMGANGAGKTTLVDVISGLITEQGVGSSVRIGAVSLARVPPELRARHIRVVDSTPPIFGGTVRENITLFRPTASAEEIRWACAVAQIDDDDDFLARSAQELSTGYRQRLVLAQAVLPRPGILILDEALAHLDAPARARVHHALARELPETIKIEVAQWGAARSSVFTRICVIDGGRIVEEGTHRQLEALGGRYAQYAIADEL
jgi:ABC-type multidrug transport system fused ATPase/permease subunit